MNSIKDKKSFRIAFDEFNKLAIKKLKEMIKEVEDGNIDYKKIKTDISYLTDKMEEVK